MAVNDKRSFDTDGEPVVVDAETEAPPALATLDAIGADDDDKGALPRAHELELTAADILQAAGQEGLLASFVVGASDMLNTFLEVDHDWMLKVAGSPIPASPAIVEAADAGKLPFTLTPAKGGIRLTSLVGMFNALLAHVGCEGKVDIMWRVDAKTREPVQLVGFEAVFPDQDEPG